RAPLVLHPFPTRRSSDLLARQTEQVALRGIVNNDVGFDTGYLNRPSLGRIVQRGCELDAGVFAERKHTLNRALAEGAVANYGGTSVILQGARDDFRG